MFLSLRSNHRSSAGAPQPGDVPAKVKGPKALPNDTPCSTEKMEHRTQLYTCAHTHTCSCLTVHALEASDCFSPASYKLLWLMNHCISRSLIFFLPAFYSSIQTSLLLCQCSDSVRHAWNNYSAEIKYNLYPHKSLNKWIMKLICKLCV